MEKIIFSLEKEKLKELSRPVHIQVFVTLTCPYCPRAVRTAHQMAVESEITKSHQ